jgi:hypothetical protein
VNLRAGLTAVMVLALLSIASVAQAQSLRISDERGDRRGPGLDVVDVRAHNRDRAAVLQVKVGRAIRGRLIVSIDPRRARGVRLVNVHLPRGRDRSFVAAGAFTDRRLGGTQACRGFRVAWRARTATLRMPSRCLNDGAYGAIRVSVLTEGRNGDSDWAPERPSGQIGNSAWIPRG